MTVADRVGCIVTESSRVVWISGGGGVTRRGRRAAAGWPGAGSDRRSFEDTAGLDFCRPGHERAESAIVALADSQLIISEAECAPTPSNNNETGQAIAKLLESATSLAATRFCWPRRHWDHGLSVTPGGCLGWPRLCAGVFLDRLPRSGTGLP